MFIDAVASKLDEILCIDIGAQQFWSSSETSIYTFAKQPKVKLLGFEPEEEERQKLIQHYAKYNMTFLPHVVGDGTQKTFYNIEASFASGCFLLNEKLYQLLRFDDGCRTIKSSSSVQTVTLDSLPEAHGTDFIKIDAESAEMMILSHALEVLKTASVVQLEVHFLPNHDGGCRYWEIGKFMEEQGFLVHQINPLGKINFEPWVTPSGISQHFAGDMVFVRDFRNLDQYDPMMLLKGATLLQDIYGSFDLASLLLREFDRQTGDKLLQLHTDRKWLQEN